MDNTTNINTMNFETALSEAKIGKKIARLQFRDTCYIVAKYPDSNSQNNIPYLQMWKKYGVVAIDNPEIIWKTFPVDLSCESIFAEDWYVIAR